MLNYSSLIVVVALNFDLRFDLAFNSIQVGRRCISPSFDSSKVATPFLFLIRIEAEYRQNEIVWRESKVWGCLNSIGVMNLVRTGV